MISEIRKKEGKTEGGKTEGKTNHERLWTPGNKLRVLERREVGGKVSLVVGIKEGTYFMEHWVLYGNNESWNITSKTNDVWGAWVAQRLSVCLRLRA